MNLSKITVVLSLAAISSLTSTSSVAKPDPTLSGLSWFVHFCKNPGTSDECEDNRKLTRGSRFRLHRDLNNDYWLMVQLYKPDVSPPQTLMKLSIPILEIEWETPEDKPPSVSFSFNDFDEKGGVITSTMTIFLLREAGQPTTNKSCNEALDEYSGSRISDLNREEQCKSVNSSVIYWRIRPGPLALSNDDPPPNVNTLGPPGDGQGSGSDEPPQ